MIEYHTVLVVSAPFIGVSPWYELQITGNRPEYSTSISSVTMNTSETNDESSNASPRPDPPSLQEELASKKSQEEEEDEMVAQARAIALSAAMLSKQKQKKVMNKGLNILNIASSDKDELPLGDLQQRKLIEAKLGQKFKQQQPDPPSNPLKAVAGLVEVKDKIDGFFKEQQQKIEDSWSQRDLKNIMGGTASGSEPASPSQSQGSSIDVSGARSIPTFDDKDGIGTAGTITRAENDAPILLSSVVYKRRSGYGKYSTSRAWERRRMDLKGSTIRYFKKTIFATSDDELTISRPSSPVEPVPIAPIIPINATADSATAAAAANTDTKHKMDIRELWEQAKENITKTTENFNKSLTSHQTLDPNAPRGSIDLIKENATVAALSGTESHSSTMSNYMGSSSASPTPFGICIIVKNENKWKICFDTQEEQMQWLVALTEVVITNNVDYYNEELTKSRRGVSNYGGSSCDDLGDASVFATEDVFRSPPGGKDNELWKIDNRYSMNNMLNVTDHGSSEDLGGGAPNIDGAQEELGADDIARDGDRATGKMAPQTPLKIVFDLVNKGATTGPVFSLMGYNLCLANCVLNVALYVVYVIESKWAFRFLILFANFIFWLLVTGASSKGDNNQRRSSLLSSIENYIYTNREGEISSSVSRDEDEPTKKKRSVAPPEIKEGFKPIAGSTTAYVKDSPGHAEINGNQFVTWDVLPLDDVQVRSHGYLKTKEKMPSPASLYEIIGCDFLSSGMRLADAATKVKLPKIDFESDDDSERTWKSPDVFVVSLAVPTEEPSFSRPASDGVGLNLTVYYIMKEETRKVLRQIMAPDYNPSELETETEKSESEIQRSTLNAIKLWENWCTNAPTDEKMQARFKFIPNVHNPKEIGLPSYIAKYCGKPVLIKRANVTGFLSTHPHLNAMEFGISLHPFPYLAKKAMAYVKTNVLPKAIISVSFVIEGRSDDELPEVLIGDGVRTKYPDLELSCECNDFLAGISKSSVIATDSGPSDVAHPVEKGDADD